MLVKNLDILFVALMLSSCSKTPFALKTLSIKEPHKIEANDARHLSDLDSVLKEGFRERYKKVGSPTFALIKGYYRLPEAHPFGAATVVQGYSYQSKIDYLNIESTKRPYVVEPVAGEEALGLNEALNSLLDAKVKILELSLADSLSIANAEKSSLKEGLKFEPAKLLPPAVDYLISINEAESKEGSLFVGRVIKKDGTLLAFRVIKASSKRLLGALVISLFEDTISRS